MNTFDFGEPVVLSTCGLPNGSFRRLGFKPQHVDGFKLTLYDHSGYSELQTTSPEDIIMHLIYQIAPLGDGLRRLDVLQGLIADLQREQALRMLRVAP